MDDNISVCKIMSFVLGRKGYSVTTAKDGPEAITRVKERPFHMIFMDIKWTACRPIEGFKKIRPEAVVVMMTAYSVEDLVQEALEEGAYTCLYKPLDIEKVLKLADQILEKKQKAA